MMDSTQTIYYRQNHEIVKIFHHLMLYFYLNQKLQYSHLKLLINKTLTHFDCSKLNKILYKYLEISDISQSILFEIITIT